MEKKSMPLHLIEFLMLSVEEAAFVVVAFANMTKYRRGTKLTMTWKRKGVQVLIQDLALQNQGSNLSCTATASTADFE